MPTQLIPSSMAKWVILGVLVVITWIAWKYLSVGRIHGRKVTQADLGESSTRLQMDVSRTQEALADCLKLQPSERLPKLLEVERRFGEVFVVGDDIRQGIVATGVSEAVPHFQRILNERHGAGSVLLGIRDALNAGNLDDGYRVQTFKFLVDGLSQKDLFRTSSDMIPGLLLGLDKEWAARLLGDICEREPDHYLFLQIVAVLNAHSLPVNPMVTEKMISDKGNTPLTRDEALRRIVAAKSLHERDPARSERILEQIMETQPQFTSDAAEALLEVRDLPHPRLLLDDLQSHLGFDSLSDEEKTAWLADHCGYLLGVDALWDFHLDERGNRLREMHEALTKVGAKRAAAILDSYLKLYGPDGPPPTVEERKKIVDTMGEEAWDRAVSEIRQNYDGWEDITDLSMQYELRHATNFRKANEIRMLLERPEKPSLFNR